MPVPPLTLVVGDEEVLVDRAVARVTAAVRAGDPQSDVLEVVGTALAPGELTGLLSPSLFGGARTLVLRDAQEIGKDLAAEVVRVLTAADALDDAVVVVTHAGGARGRALLDGLSAAGATVVRCARLTNPGDRVDFVRGEFGAAGRRIEAEAATALLASVGTDLRELATACAQLIADTAGTVVESTVSRYHRGRADVTGFAVADRAVEGDAAGAVEVLRWAQSTGVAPVLVTSSLAANLRLIARVAGEGRGSPLRIAKAIGAPVWKVEKALRWARGWTPGALSTAVRAVAVADGEVKGAAVDADYAVERVVRAVASARDRR